METEDSQPQWLKHNAKSGKLALAPIHRVVFDLLNIDESFYDVETGFNVIKQQMYARAKLKVSLTLKVDFTDGVRVIGFEKGDTILLWRRAAQTTALDISRQLERSGFYVLQSSQSEDHEYILTIAEAGRRSF